MRDRLGANYSLTLPRANQLTLPLGKPVDQEDSVSLPMLQMRRLKAPSKT